MSKENDKDKGGRMNINVSRREALIAAFTGGLVNSINGNTVSAQRPTTTKGEHIGGDRVGVEITDNMESIDESDASDVYRQIKVDENGDMSSGIEFHLDDEFEISLTSLGSFDGVVTVDISARINQNVDEDEFGEENTDDEELFQAWWDSLTRVDNDFNDVDEIEFNLVDGGDFDISENIEDGEIIDGKVQLTGHEEISDEEPKNSELGVDLPTDRTSVDGVPRNRSKIEVRTRVFSNDGSIDEEITIVIILDMTPELGLGKLLGYNLAKNRIPEWDKNDWEAQRN